MSFCTSRPRLHFGQREGSIPVKARYTSQADSPSNAGNQIVFPIKAIACCRFVSILAVARIP